MAAARCISFDLFELHSFTDASYCDCCGLVKLSILMLSTVPGRSYEDVVEWFCVPMFYRKRPDQNWAQCDKCQQWRRMPDGINNDKLPEEWFCYMNPDPQFRSESCKVLALIPDVDTLHVD